VALSHHQFTGGEVSILDGGPYAGTVDITQ